jgi:hemolysin III
MSKTSASTGRAQSTGEEIANSISHGLGALAAITAIPVLIIGALRDGGAANVVGAATFGVTLLLLYLASTIYHALPPGKAKRVFVLLDHSAIFLLIAGTYTPFTLGVLRGTWGWSLLGAVWGLALLGVLAKAKFGVRHQVLATSLYLAMGWLILVAVKPLITLVPLSGLLWLLAGGLAYTLGVIFFVLDSRVRYAHFVWHLFVVSGSLCHFMAVFWYAA